MIRIVGDVHGKWESYHNVIRAQKNDIYSIQLGDMGFDYHHLSLVDATKHKILAGNHDAYDKMNTAHWLGDFIELNNVQFFFVRGAKSIDKNFRISY